LPPPWLPDYSLACFASQVVKLSQGREGRV
jgi:hypothetical protein